MYSGGYPDFSIEKPTLAIFQPDWLKQKQQTGEWYGELKLTVQRGFLTTDCRGRSTYYRHTKPQPEITKTLHLPPSSVFDVGLFQHGKLKRFYVFDVLVLDGNNVKETCLQRRRLLESIDDAHEMIWRPLYTDLWYTEYLQMQKNSSMLIKKSSEQYGIAEKDLKGYVEGLVCKRKKSRLTFPSQTSFTGSSFFKLRLGLS